MVAWHSGRMSASGRRTFPVLRWWVTTNVGKPSAIGQPTRPTQPFILSGSINWVVSWNQMCAAVYSKRHLVKATEVTAGLTESNGSLLPVYGLIHFTSPAGWLPVHRDQLRAQRSVTSMGKLLLFTSLHYSLLTIDSYILLLLDNNYLHVTEVYRIFALRARLRWNDLNHSSKNKLGNKSE